MNKLALAAVAAVAATSLSSFATAQQQRPTYQPKQESTASCGSQLGHLPRVYREDVAGIDDYHRVWVTELCANFGLLRSEGNAEYLRTTIADNEVLTDVLRSKSFTSEDVFAVKMMGDDTVNLYVYNFDR